MSGPMMASDDNNPNFLGARNPDAALWVKFHSKSVEQPYESTMQGRPIFKNVDYIEIRIPGDKDNVIDTPVRHEHKIRFHQQWAAYQAGKGDGTEVGTDQ